MSCGMRLKHWMIYCSRKLKWSQNNLATFLSHHLVKKRILSVSEYKNLQPSHSIFHSHSPSKVRIFWLRWACAKFKYTRSLTVWSRVSTFSGQAIKWSGICQLILKACSLWSLWLSDTINSSIAMELYRRPSCGDACQIMCWSRVMICRMRQDFSRLPRKGSRKSDYVSLIPT